MTEPLTPEEDARDSLESYNDAMRAIGERVKAGASVPAFLRSGLPAEPRQAKAYFAAVDAFIAYATKLKDWPAVEEAIDLKVGEQGKFVRWWDEVVRSQGEARKENPDLRFLSVDQAERRTDIKQQ